MTNDTRIPALSVKDGNVVANSRDVAKFFGKEHRNVLSDVDRLLLEIKQQGFFVETTSEIKTGFGCRSYRSYDMTRDGFALLAMGFTGPKALKFKLAYIQQFNAMEAELRKQAPTITAVQIPDAAEMEFIRLAKQVKGERFASALWDQMGI